MTRTRVVRVAALLALVAAALLVLVAVDVRRWDRSLAAQDVRFLASPRQAKFSEPQTLLPFGIAAAALAGTDDLVFREHLEGFARVRPGAVFVYTEQLQTLRGGTQLGLARLSRVDPDDRRRSRAGNMIGVLALDPQLAPRDAAEFQNLVQGAIGSFRNAVEIDPANADAKLNLELALRIPGPANVPGPDPSGTRNVGDRSGLARPGGGY